MKLYYNGKSDPAAAIIRAEGLPHTDTRRVAYVTDTRFESFLPLFIGIGDHLAFDDAGRPCFRQPFMTHAQALHTKCKDAAAAIIDHFEAEYGEPHPGQMLFLDLERHQIGRFPFADDHRDQMLAQLLNGQVAAEAFRRWGFRPLVSEYHTVRAPAVGAARLSRASTWGTMSPSFEAHYGAEGVGGLLGQQGAYWAHCYLSEGEILAGVSHADYFYHAAKYHLRQYMASPASGPILFVDWLYSAIDSTCGDFIRGVRKAVDEIGFEGEAGICFCHNSKLPIQTDSDTPEARAAKFADLWSQFVAEPFAAATEVTA